MYLLDLLQCNYYFIFAFKPLSSSTVVPEVNGIDVDNTGCSHQNERKGKANRYIQLTLTYIQDKINDFYGWQNSAVGVFMYMYTDQ